MVFISLYKVYAAWIWSCHMAFASINAGSITAERRSMPPDWNINKERDTNRGSYYGVSSGLNMSVFLGLDCPTQPYESTLPYGGEFRFYYEGPPINFTSFKISRPLGEQEQLDVSRFGQDGGQTRIWECGAFVVRYRLGTPAGCHNVPDGTAACVRLWHY